MKKIIDGAAFAQELRIGGDTKSGLGIPRVRSKQMQELFASFHWHGAALDQQPRRLRGPGDGLCDRIQGREIVVSILGLRDSYTQKCDVDATCAGAEV